MLSNYKVILFRNLRMAWSFPVWILISLMQPIFWLVMYGALMNSLEVKYGSSVLSYITYFSAGIIAATAIFSSLWSGITIMQDLQNGMLNRLLWSGCSKASIVAAYITQSLVSIVFQCTVILLLAMAMGANLQLNFLTAIETTFAVILLGTSLSSLSHFLALLLRKNEAMISVITFITMPIFFISGIIFPMEFGPTWLKNIAWINPAQHGSEIIRYILLSNHGDYFYLLGSISYLFGFALLFFGCSLLFVKIEG